MHNITSILRIIHNIMHTPSYYKNIHVHVVGSHIRATTHH
jgi:hypothetical protein